MPSWTADVPWSRVVTFAGFFRCVGILVVLMCEEICACVTTGEIFHHSQTSKISITSTQLWVLSMCSWWLGPEPLGPERSVTQTTGGEHWKAHLQPSHLQCLGPLGAILSLLLYSPYTHHCKSMGVESNIKFVVVDLQWQGYGLSHSSKHALNINSYCRSLVRYVPRIGVLCIICYFRFIRILCIFFCICLLFYCLLAQ